MKTASQIFGILAVVGIAVLLFLYDGAAEPGRLSSAHDQGGDCKVCHTPWRWVSDERCVACHDVKSIATSRREIRFHQAGKHCLVCHKEHGMLDRTTSKMDHTILNGQLLCTQCHFDRHGGRFGSNCRQCHGIRSWRIASYRHPAEGRRDCIKCHNGPASHDDVDFWRLILKDMPKQKVSQKDCWRCHTIYHWRHLKMRHEPREKQEALTDSYPDRALSNCDQHA
ncbi:MAG: cytochrome c3 family protein [Deltaproteobacteria bacterium]|nr:cytochrome c3 family protein [Deltaproteobacteria bacterium]